MPVHLVPFRPPEMVRIPAGRFLMGCQPGEAECGDDEKPAHRVRVPAFDLGKTEATFADWDACVADGGCCRKPEEEGRGHDDRPMINVSWADAQQYIQWLSRKSDQTYRLTSEAEWEYAARVGTTTAFRCPGGCGAGEVGANPKRHATRLIHPTITRIRTPGDRRISRVRAPILAN